MGTVRDITPINFLIFFHVFMGQTDPTYKIFEASTFLLFSLVLKKNYDIQLFERGRMTLKKTHTTLFS